MTLRVNNLMTLFVFNEANGELINKTKNVVFAYPRKQLILDDFFLCTFNEEQVSLVKLRNSILSKKFELEDFSNCLMHVSSDRQSLFLISQAETAFLWQLSCSDLSESLRLSLGRLTQIRFLANDQLIGLDHDPGDATCCTEVNFSDRNSHRVWSVVLVTVPPASSPQDLSKKEVYRSSVEIRCFDTFIHSENQLIVGVVLVNGLVVKCQYRLERLEHGFEAHFVQMDEIFDPASVVAQPRPRLSKRNTIEFYRSSLQVAGSNWQNNEVFKSSQQNNPILKLKTKRFSKFEKSSLRPECFLVCRSETGLAVYCESQKEAETGNRYTFFVNASFQHNKHRAKIEIEENPVESELESFKILEIPNKKRNEREHFNFLIYSHLKILLVMVKTGKLEVSIAKVVDQSVERQLDIHYSAGDKFFFVPNEEYLDIWDRTFSHKVYSVALGRRIKGFRVMEDSRSIILYDKYRSR